MNREKWYFIRDFIKEFFLVILKILTVIAIFAGVAFVFYSCIIQPLYLLAVGGCIVIFCIGRYAYKEAQWKRSRRENAMKSLKTEKEKLHEYETKLAHWESILPSCPDKQKEIENEIAFCKHQISYRQERFNEELGRYLYNGGKIKDVREALGET